MTPPKCNKCGKKCVKRKSRFGGEFWGCSQFPRCRGKCSQGVSSSPSISSNFMAAKFPSTCKECKRRINVGDIVEKGTWIHEKCAKKRASKQIDIPSQFIPGNSDYIAPTEQSTSIRNSYINTKSHLIVDAKAGAGKTTLLEWLLSTTVDKNRAPDFLPKPKWNQQQVLFLAFNRNIKAELQERVGGKIPGVRVGTLNGYGNSIIARHYSMKRDNSKLNDNKIRDIAQTLYPYTGKARKVLKESQISFNRVMVKALVEVVSKVKGMLASPADYPHVIDKFKIDLGFDEEYYEEFYKAIDEVLLRDVKMVMTAKEFDYDDQIWLPTIAVGAKFWKNPGYIPEYINLVEEMRIYPSDVVFIDETQDLNRAQVILSMLAAGMTYNGREVSTKGKIIAVGDPFQCVTEDSLIDVVDNGKVIQKKAKDITRQDRLLSACGAGQTKSGTITDIYKKKIERKIVRLKTKSGKTLELTPEHVLFGNYEIEACKEDDIKLHFVYLMKKSSNFRIGISQLYRRSDGKIIAGYKGRTSQEGGDACWIIRTCKNESEARLWESFYSLKYGIPTIVFRAASKSMTQDHIDKLFKMTESACGARLLMESLSLDPHRPHHKPKCMQKSRRNFSVTMFGDARSENCVLHRYSISGSNPEDESVMEDLQLNVRKSKFNKTKNSFGWRVESSHKDISNIYSILDNVRCKLDVNVIEKAKFTNGQALNFISAASIREGMSVFVENNLKVEKEIIENVEWIDYSGYVYDFNIQDFHNYSVNGVFVHNSIYAFRGADSNSMSKLFQTLEETERGCMIKGLSVCWRCPRSVIERAQEILELPEEETIQAAPHAPEGEILHIEDSEIHEFLSRKDAIRTRSGHTPVMILSRRNAPLISMAFKLISKKLPVTIRGRDILKTVLSFIEAYNPKGNESATVFMKTLRDFYAAELERIMDQDGIPSEEATAKIQPLRDKIDTITNLSAFPEVKRTDSIQSLIDTLDQLFKMSQCPSCRSEIETSEKICPNCMAKSGKEVRIPEVEGILLSTVHRSKGLEALRVFLIDLECITGAPPWVNNNPRATEEDWKQEQNLYYVAVTRTKFSLKPQEKDISGKLYYVHEEDPANKKTKRKEEEKEESFIPETTFEAGSGNVGYEPENIEYEPEIEIEEIENANLIPIEMIHSMNLPSLPKKGAGTYAGDPTEKDWIQIRDLYLTVGIPAKITVLPGWRQYALVVNGVVASNTTVNTHGGARGKGKKALRIIELDEHGKFQGRKGKTIKRTQGWKGRVIERINQTLINYPATVGHERAYNSMKSLD